MSQFEKEASAPQLSPKDLYINAYRDLVEVIKGFDANETKCLVIDDILVCMATLLNQFNNDIRFRKLPSWWGNVNTYEIYTHPFVIDFHFALTKYERENYHKENYFMPAVNEFIACLLRGECIVDLTE